MVSAWPVSKKEWNFAEEDEAVEMMKEAVRASRTVRTSMNVAPSKKATVYVVSEDAKVRDIFEHNKIFFATLGYANEVLIQSDKAGIAEDAVSAVTARATMYMPFAELVDVAKERNIPIRVGVNSGSLEKHILEKYGKVTAEGIVESA